MDDRHLGCESGLHLRSTMMTELAFMAVLIGYGTQQVLNFIGRLG